MLLDTYLFKMIKIRFLNTHRDFLHSLIGPSLPQCGLDTNNISSV
jgi:hypothetical protein